MNRILLSCAASLGIVLLLAFLTGAAFAFQDDMSGAQTPVPGDSKDSARQARERAQKAREHAQQVRERAKQAQERAKQNWEHAQKARRQAHYSRCLFQCVKDNAGRTEEERAQICWDACHGSDQK